MTFTCSDLSKAIKVNKNIHNILVVENQQVFSRIISEICYQCSGGEGEVAFYKELDKVSWQNDIEVIIDIFNLNQNNKKTIAALYSQIKNFAYEQDCYLETSDITANIINYIQRISRLIDYPIDFQESIDVTAILKLVSLKFTEEYSNLVEKIIDYITIVNTFLKKEIFLFVNLKTFLREEDILEIYKIAEYKGLNIFLIEARDYKKIHESEVITIIDADLCEITY